MKNVKAMNDFKNIFLYIVFRFLPDIELRNIIISLKELSNGEILI